ncbi:MAG TPA: hypothetical protein VFJ95_07480 [Gammaproteobacteria bacterium]|nr:hypothetical protein [Gammaproteobacteria bacterium]
MALGRADLIRPLVEDKRLVYLSEPREMPIATHAYWLIRASAAARSEVRDVAAWIEAEASPREAARG